MFQVPNLKFRNPYSKLQVPDSGFQTATSSSNFKPQLQTASSSRSPTREVQPRCGQRVSQFHRWGGIPALHESQEQMLHPCADVILPPQTRRAGSEWAYAHWRCPKDSNDPMTDEARTGDAGDST